MLRVKNRRNFILRTFPERRIEMLSALLRRLENYDLGKDYPLTITERALLIEALSISDNDLE